jgi:glutamate decarboxylase
MHISSTIAALGPFELVSDGSELPVVAFRMKEGSAYTVYDVSDRLRMHGWTVPAYPMPPAVEDVHVLRVVIRNGMSMDMAEMLLSDLAREIDILDSVGSPGTPDLKQFSH